MSELKVFCADTPGHSGDAGGGIMLAIAERGEASRGTLCWGGGGPDREGREKRPKATPGA